MYSEEYDKRAKGKIDLNVTQTIFENTKTVISSMKYADKIGFYFSIMEIEAWWLSMYSIFKKINDKLDIDFIHKSLGYKLNDINAETEFYHPSVILKKIFDLVDMKYDKKFDDVKKITSKIDENDIENGISNNRCERFKMFCDEIKGLIDNNSTHIHIKENNV